MGSRRKKIPVSRHTCPDRPLERVWWPGRPATRSGPDGQDEPMVVQKSLARNELRNNVPAHGLPAGCSNPPRSRERLSPMSWLRFPVGRPRRPRRFVPHVEGLDARVVPAVTATFLPVAGTLTVVGDSLDNTIVVSRNAAGGLLVNGGAVAVTGGTPTVANTALIQVFGQGGNDTITLDETNGALPAAQLF